MRTVAIVSSSGLRDAYQRSDAYATIEVRAGVGTEQTSAGAMAVTSGIVEIDLEVVAAEGVRRAVRLVGGRRPAGGTMPVLLDSTAAASLVAVLGRLVNAALCQRGRSLLAGRVGERVAATSVSLVDDGR